ncbi:ABC-2 type transport system permease protein [Jannaschia faecimaris]|uniref:Transport permease protein n=1 Tax=Jannaschia faecimaris TaxID=1244108 RepID=A0A1H3LAH8_9RHOB|nr:ABC transporter permease [Jannaschia faecimaris]SDY61310.1 ABC-2 type transport system permease protein [Jannaschia faecimaris]
MTQTAHPTVGSATEMQQGVRRFGAVNWLGMWTLIGREVRRFASVWTQTLLAPLATAGLFMLVFTLAVGPTRGDVMGLPFIHFLAPGILMMTVIQNSFANVSSSIVISKVQGNIVDTLMPPLSATELLVGYLAGGILRGVVVALAISLLMFPFIGLGVKNPVMALVWVALGGAFLGSLGVIAGVFANKFDQMAAITNFIITPLSFLSGTFYSIEGLPPIMRALSHANPVFYLIDGLRSAVLGVSDSSPVLGLTVVIGATLFVCSIAWWMFRTGYRLKS